MGLRNEKETKVQMIRAKLTPVVIMSNRSFLEIAMFKNLVFGITQPVLDIRGTVAGPKPNGGIKPLRKRSALMICSTPYFIFESNKSPIILIKSIWLYVKLFSVSTRCTKTNFESG